MFSDPSHNIEQFDLQSGMKVADFGTGSGHYALAAARAVGDRGKVYALDVQKNLLEKLKREASHKRVHNIDVLWADIEKQGGTHLRDSSIDAAIVANVLFQLEHRADFIAELRRILRGGARVMVIDWRDSFGGLGPKLEHVVSPEAGRLLFESTGFTMVRPISAGDHHWGFVFAKN